MDETPAPTPDANPAPTPPLRQAVEHQRRLNFALGGGQWMENLAVVNFRDSDNAVRRMFENVAVVNFGGAEGVRRLVDTPRINLGSSATDAIRRMVEDQQRLNRALVGDEGLRRTFESFRQTANALAGNEAIRHAVEARGRIVDAVAPLATEMARVQSQANAVMSQFKFVGSGPAAESIEAMTQVLDLTWRLPQPAPAPAPPPAPAVSPSDAAPVALEPPPAHGTTLTPRQVAERVLAVLTVIVVMHDSVGAFDDMIDYLIALLAWLGW